MLLIMTQFADYVLAGYITDSSTFPPTMWAAVPDLTSKCTNNEPESFHSKLNAHFYASHTNIFLFVDVIKKMQETTYIKKTLFSLHTDVKWKNISLLLHSLNVIRRVRRQEVTLLNA